MWGEGASDLWGLLEEAEAEREVELLEPLRARLRSSGGQVREEADESSDNVGLQAA
jgi:sensor domain CHASE-containing protein